MADGEDTRRERVIFPMSYYSEHKAAVKAPFKELGLTWRYLGQEGDATKGRYQGEGVDVFVKYTGEHADFTITATDEDRLATLLEAWEGMPRVEPEEEGAAAESPLDEAMQKEVERWRFKEPTRRPGEPEAFYEKRVAAWEAQDPRG